MVLDKRCHLCNGIDRGSHQTVYFFSYYISGTYQSSWVYIVKDWSDENWTFWANTLNTVSARTKWHFTTSDGITDIQGLCTFGVIAGLVYRFTHRYKWTMIFGLVVRLIGTALAFAATYNASDALIVAAPIVVSIGSGFFTIGANIAAQASVPHADLAIASAILYLLTA